LQKQIDSAIATGEDTNSRVQQLQVDAHDTD
jgi:hypothetical protein